MTPLETSIHEPPLPPLAGLAFGELDYRALMGVDPIDARIDDDEDFDRHVLASILAVADLTDSSGLERVGLARAELFSLFMNWFPDAIDSFTDWRFSAPAAEDDEIVMVRELLLANRSTSGDIGRWLSDMIARRSMEPNHLWEDLGLRERSELTRLLARHFSPVFTRNTRNMRWKRFFYRLLCEDDGFVMCTTPVCTQCRDFDLCFGDESGESRLAERRRDIASRAEGQEPAIRG